MVETASPAPNYVRNALNTERRSIFRRIFRRTVFGVLFALPILLTVFLVYQIYLMLNAWVIEPVAGLILPQGIENPYWQSIENYVTAPISLMTVVLSFYFLGYAFQSRLSRWVDGIFEHIPGISILYRAIRDASRAVQGPDGLKKIDTVVLVPFPHPNARATGFLMGECNDAETGSSLVCVYVPIALFPPSGYTLLFQREDVTFTQWEASAPWKLVLSGGLTIPSKVPFQTSNVKS